MALHPFIARMMEQARIEAVEQQRPERDRARCQGEGDHVEGADRHDREAEESTADGELLLIDEVHTPDSSRWWIESTYADRLDRGTEPESLDKEAEFSDEEDDGVPISLDETNF